MQTRRDHHYQAQADANQFKALYQQAADDLYSKTKALGEKMEELDKMYSIYKDHTGSSYYTRAEILAAKDHSAEMQTTFEELM